MTSCGSSCGGGRRELEAVAVVGRGGTTDDAASGPAADDGAGAGVGAPVCNMAVAAAAPTAEAWGETVERAPSSVGLELELTVRVGLVLAGEVESS